MALSFATVQKAYTVFNKIKKELLPELEIPSWPLDMGEWDDEKKTNPPLLQVHGWGKKSDDGWESIAFFVKDPSEELISRFEELRLDIKSNTHINGKYHRNEKIWCIGWF
ncbi:hypothetical protein CMT52_13125 [Elizabethkingia anophelis]|nr:hypothetical protein [Elizabethkingia anophelis]